MGTFLVSGLMHELILFYYVECDQRSPWEVTCFFLLHGVCLLTEIALKKRFGGRWQLPRLVTGPLTIGFVLFTGFQLFLPSLDRCKAFEKAYVELAALMAFLGKESQRLADYLVRGLKAGMREKRFGKKVRSTLVQDWLPIPHGW
ncbi:hypothetical protein NC653_002820 [Populus alba x Populus x berolinensis]|uniref:Wax synthase domain-containing protein n=1 Tax=Populus alba x Populus x berolinensis TaxID=444605 RepID=A0AAD6RQ18_9ROSI|nr:hypothetical protein NC653_002820 [Populus alba x Populus x berolinensis]